MNVGSIPLELRILKQWVCCKADKNLFQVNGQQAKTNDPNTWNTFEACVDAIGKYDLISVGLVLTKDDPYFIIDLDKTSSNPQWILLHQQIHDDFDTYSEVSSSGNGCHIIGKGELQGIDGFKNVEWGVECYSSGRYMIFTGNIYNQKPIAERQNLLNKLHQAFRPTIKVSPTSIEPSNLSDVELVNKIYSAANGSVFEGFYKSGYPEGSDRSSVDMAFMNFMAFYSVGAEQAIRLIKASALANDRINGPKEKRKKFSREDYLINTYNDAVSKPLAKLPLIIDIGDYKDIVSKKISKPISNSMTPEFFKPLGILGEVAQFVYDDSPRQIAEAAFLAADCFFGGIAGKAFNVSGTGLNQYNLLLANTGYGKGAVENCIDRLVYYLTSYARGKGYMVAADELKLHIGPTFASGQGLIAQLAISNCFSSTLDEFGLLLAKISDNKASGSDKAYYSNLLQLYNKSGYMQTFKGVKHSKKDNDIPEIVSPSVTLALLSTASSYYDVIKSSDFANGLIPRIFTMEYTGPRPSLNLNAHSIVPSDGLLQRICDYITHSYTLRSANRVTNVKISNEMKLAIDSYVGNKIKEAESNNKKPIADLWSRADMKAMKKAALFATCINPWYPEITTELMDISFKLIEDDIIRTSNHIMEGSISGDSDWEDKANRIVSGFLVRYINSPMKDLPNQKHLVEKLHTNKTIGWSYLQASVSLITAAKNSRSTSTVLFTKAMDNLIKGGYVSKVSVMGLDGSYYKINGIINNMYSD